MVFAQPTALETSVTVDGENQMCGEENVKGQFQYSSYDKMRLCIVYEDYDQAEANKALAARKVQYEIVVDKFGLVEVQGL